MAKRKTTKSRKKEVLAQKKQSTFTRKKAEIILVVGFALSVLLGLCCYLTDAGIVGNAIKQFMLGTFGLPVMALPLVLFVGLIHYLRHKGAVPYQYIFWGALFLTVCGLFHLIGGYMGSFDAGTFYREGMNMIGGGFLGGCIAYGLKSLVSFWGALVVLLCLCVVFVLLVTNLSLSTIYHKLQESRQAFIDDRRERLEAEEEEEEERPRKKRREKEPKAEVEEKTPIFVHEPIDIPDTRPEAPQGEQIELEEVLEEEPVVEEEDNTPPVAPEEVAAEIADKPVQTGYIFPPISLLNRKESKDTFSEAAVNQTAEKLVATLKSFGVETTLLGVSHGPSVTRYELQPHSGVKVSKIVNLADDIALNLAARGVRIEAPIPGKAAVGIEVPNTAVAAVYIREVLDNPVFANAGSPLSFVLGRDIGGNPVVSDIGSMPHLLIAGATGSGKSVCINTLIISLLYKSSPEDVRLLMVDPKVVELGVYNGIPHLLIPVVTEPKKAAGALGWAVAEMTRRYNLFAEHKVRDIKGYNAKVEEQSFMEGELETDNDFAEPRMEKLPNIVIIIDELADLMMVAPKDVEDHICRLAQMARAAGMHLVIATQRPSVDVITGIIKANIPSRIAFKVSSQVDSRTILDVAGAEKLLGKGDMLYYPVGAAKPQRMQGAFITESEVEAVVKFVKGNYTAVYQDDIIEHIENGVSAGNNDDRNEEDEMDEQFYEALEACVESGQASATLLQRKIKVGYARAARIIDQLEDHGYVGPYEGSKPRTVLITRDELSELLMRRE